MRYPAMSLTHAFGRSRRNAGAPNATFHDRRQTFVTNARRGGVDYLCGMVTTGHKTMAVFKLDNPVDEVDLRQAMEQDAADGHL